MQELLSLTSRLGGFKLSALSGRTWEETQPSEGLSLISSRSQRGGKDTKGMEWGQPWKDPLDKTPN